MNGPFQVAQANTGTSNSNSGSGPVRIYKLTKPLTDQAVIVNIGYADGYLRGFSSRGSGFAGEFALPVLGRVSMDLLALGCDAVPELKEGDWVEIAYDLPTASEASGVAQYELLTTLGSRFERIWS